MRGGDPLAPALRAMASNTWTDEPQEEDNDQVAAIQKNEEASGASAPLVVASVRSNRGRSDDCSRQPDVADDGSVDGMVAVKEGEPGRVTGQVSEPKNESDLAPPSAPVFSTKTGLPLRLVSPSSVSTKNSPQLVTQEQLVGSSSKAWKRLKGKPPIPDKHVVNPSGKKTIGRRLRVGYEILRRVPCSDCGVKERRLVAGFISATQLFELEQEDYETKVGIIRTILRKTVADIDGRIQHLRCAGCESRREGGLKAVAQA